MSSNAGFHRFHQDAADAKRLRLAPNRHGCLVMDESGHKVWCPSDLKLKAQALFRKNSHETTLRGHRHVTISANIKHLSTNVNISNHKKNI